MGDWTEVIDEESNSVYYYNTVTNQTSWEKPTELTTEVEKEWELLFDETTGRNYYYNNSTGDVSWEVPEETLEDNDTVEILPPDWTQELDENGTVFYYNASTGETSWEIPKHIEVSDVTQSEEASGWAKLYDDASESYYYSNNVTGEIQWEVPAAMESSADYEYGQDFKSGSEVEVEVSSFQSDSSTMSLYESTALHLPNYASSTNLLHERVSSTVESVAKSPRNQRNGYVSAPEQFITDFFTQMNSNASSSSSPNNSSGSFNKNNKDVISYQQDDSKSLEHDGQLTPEEVAAITKLNSIDSNTSTTTITTALQVSDIILSIDSDVYKSATVLSHLIKKLRCFTMMNYAKEYFQYDRKTQRSNNNNNNNFNINSSNNSNIDADALIYNQMIEKLLSYQGEPLKSPLISYPLYINIDMINTANSISTTTMKQQQQQPYTTISPSLLVSDSLDCFHLITSFISYDNSEYSTIDDDKDDVTTTILNYPSHQHSHRRRRSSGSKNDNNGSHHHHRNHQNKLSQMDIAARLLQKLLSLPTTSASFPAELLYDEVYCQLCKQTYKNPSSDARELGWQLMLLCLSSVPPSKRLLPYLMNYIAGALDNNGHNADYLNNSSINIDNSSNDDVSISFLNIRKFVMNCLLVCSQAAAFPVRKEVPTRAEIRALLLGECLEIRVYTLEIEHHNQQQQLLLYGGRFYSFAVTSYTTMDQLHARMSRRLAITMPEYKDMFALYEIPYLDAGAVAGDNSVHAAAVAVLLHPQERVVDWIAQRQQRRITSRDHHHHQQQQQQNYRNNHSSYDTNDNISYIGSEESNSSNNNYYNNDNGQQDLLQPSHRIIYKARYMFPISEYRQDKATMDLLYVQAQFDVLTAYYPHTFVDALLLASFQLQELCGDHITGTRYLSDMKIIPSSSTAAAAVMVATSSNNSSVSGNNSRVCSPSLSRLVSSFILDSIINSSNMVGVVNTSSPYQHQCYHDIEQRIIQLHKALVGVSKSEARNMYLTFMSSWKIFGATFFSVSTQQLWNHYDGYVSTTTTTTDSSSIVTDTSSSNSYSEVILCVAAHSILVMDSSPSSSSRTQSYLAEYSYDKVISWAHAFDSFVILVDTNMYNQNTNHNNSNSNSNNNAGSKRNSVNSSSLLQEKLYFKTSQGKDIDALVHVYYQHYYHLRKRKEDKN